MGIKLKSQKEIEILREGGKHLAAILRALKEKSVPGASTKDLDDLAFNMCKEFGDKPAFLNYKPYGADRAYPASLCLSINDEIVHGIPNENPKILKEGDIVSLDMGLIHKGMIVDSAITVPVGEISKESRRLIDATKEATTAGIRAAKLGGHIGDIGAAIEEIAKKYGYGIAQGLCGHGVGYEVHEEPYVPNEGKVGQGPKLEEGLVIAIEPMFNTGTGKTKIADDGYTYKTKDGGLSAHFEHTVAITKDGVIILTE